MNAIWPPASGNEADEWTAARAATGETEAPPESEPQSDTEPCPPPACALPDSWTRHGMVPQRNDWMW